MSHGNLRTQLDGRFNDPYAYSLRSKVSFPLYLKFVKCVFCRMRPPVTHGLTRHTMRQSVLEFALDLFQGAFLGTFGLLIRCRIQARLRCLHVLQLGL
jgi:hypothetical protein